MCRVHFLPGILQNLHETRRFNDLGRSCCFEWDACDRGNVRTSQPADADLRSSMDGFLGVLHIPRGISSPRGRDSGFFVSLMCLFCTFLHDFDPFIACLRGVKYWKILENRCKSAFFPINVPFLPQKSAVIGPQSGVFAASSARKRPPRSICATSFAHGGFCSTKASVEGQDTPHSTYTRPLPPRQSSGRPSPLTLARPENGQASRLALSLRHRSRIKSRTSARPALCNEPRSSLSQPE